MQLEISRQYLLQMTVFYFPCSLVQVYQCLRGAFCLHFQGELIDISQNADSLILAYVRTSSITQYTLHARLGVDVATMKKSGA